MTIRNREIEDSLDEWAEQAIEEVKDYLIEYCEENEELTCPDISDLDDDDDGRIHEIIDSNVPIYTYEIRCQWFLHEDDLTEAYENHGFGYNPLENDGMTAIYCYISDKVYEWWNENAEDVFDEWYEEKGNSEEEEEESE